MIIEITNVPPLTPTQFPLVCLYGASKIVQIYFEFSETLSDHKIVSDYHPKKILDGAFVNSRILPGTMKFC